jgi:hypothetical protein
VATAPTLGTEDLDRLLTTIPSDYALGASGDARFVVGPGGGFILQVMGVDLERAAHDLLSVTNATRLALSDHLPWVPFLDPLLVTPEAITHHPDVTVVPLDLVIDVLRDGHQRLDEHTVERILVLLVERRLEPTWSLMAWPEARIGLLSESESSTWPSASAAILDLPYAD